MSRACPQVSKFSKSLSSDHSVSSFLIEIEGTGIQGKTGGHDPTFTESAVEWKNREKNLTTLVCIPWGSLSFPPFVEPTVTHWALLYWGSLHYGVCRKRTPSWYRWPWSIGYHLTGTDQCRVRKEFTSEIISPVLQVGPYICWHVSFSTGNCRVEPLKPLGSCEGHKR